jgi:hypothetical protein
MYSGVVTARAHRIALAAVVLPLVLLIGLRTAWAAYACQMDGELRAACCCPAPTSPERVPADGAARLASAACCDLQLGEPASAPEAREAERACSHHDHIPVIAPRFHAPVATVSRATGPVANARPPPTALPLYLANLTLLC